MPSVLRTLAVVLILSGGCAVPGPRGADLALMDVALVNSRLVLVARAPKHRSAPKGVGQIDGVVRQILNDLGITSGGVYTPPASAIDGTTGQWTVESDGDLVSTAGTGDIEAPALDMIATTGAARVIAADGSGGATGASMTAQAATAGVNGVGGGYDNVGGQGVGSGDGGDVALTAGEATGSGAGGSVTLTAGTSDSGTPGAIVFSTDDGTLTLAATGGLTHSGGTATFSGLLPSTDSERNSGSSATRWLDTFTDRVTTQVLVTSTNPTTISATDPEFVVLDTSASGVEIDLPAVAGLADGWRLVVKRVGAGFNGTVDPSGSELIDSSSTSLSLSVNFQTVTIVKVTIGGTGQFVIE